MDYSSMSQKELYWIVFSGRNSRDERIEALDLITDQNLLAKIAKEWDWGGLENHFGCGWDRKYECYFTTRLSIDAALRITDHDLLLAIAVDDDAMPEVRYVIVLGLEEPEDLLRVAQHHNRWGCNEARDAAMERLDKAAIIKLAQTSDDEKIRVAALRHMNPNTGSYTSIAMGDPSAYVRSEATKRLINPAFLRRIMESDEDVEVRCAALRRLFELEH